MQGRSFTKSANIPEWQKSPCITLQTKHFLNIVAQSMQANTWPQGSNLASAVLPHKRHFTFVSLPTADDDLAWAESVSSREGGVASSGFLADALMENRNTNWVKKEQPSVTTTVPQQLPPTVARCTQIQTVRIKLQFSFFTVEDANLLPSLVALLV